MQNRALILRPAFAPIRRSFQKMSVSDACKPSSVEGGHLSRPIVTDGFKRNPESLTGRLKRSFVSCSEWGLHRGQVARPRVSSYLTFPPLHARGHAVSLCCTLPGVAPAGRYPALCPMELGLSSHLSARGRPAASQTNGLYHIFTALSTPGGRDEIKQLIVRLRRVRKQHMHGKAPLSDRHHHEKARMLHRLRQRERDHHPGHALARRV